MLHSMSLHILLCGEVLSYFISRIGILRSLNLNLNQRSLKV
jgi:hypothetical protein